MIISIQSMYELQDRLISDVISYINSFIKVNDDRFKKNL